MWIKVLGEKAHRAGGGTCSEPEGCEERGWEEGRK